MLVKKISYHDLDGDMREDDFYFSMNETEFARLNRQFPGGLEKFAQKVEKDKNADNMFYVIDTLVRTAYGERQENGFVKVAPTGLRLSEFFVNTEAYDNLMVELMQNEDSFIAFMSGCLNKNAQDRVKAEMAKAKAKAEGGLTPVDDEKPKLEVVNPQ